MTESDNVCASELFVISPSISTSLTHSGLFAEWLQTWQAGIITLLINQISTIPH